MKRHVVAVLHSETTTNWFEPQPPPWNAALRAPVLQDNFGAIGQGTGKLIVTDGQTNGDMAKQFWADYMSMAGQPKMQKRLLEIRRQVNRAYRGGPLTKNERKAARRARRGGQASL